MDTRLSTLDFHPQALWPAYRPTDLIELPALADRAGVGRVLVKLENQRPLGNFKSLGGFCAGLRALARHAGLRSLDQVRCQQDLPPLLCASEGNHGLAVAAAAHHAGTRACVYLPIQVSDRRAARIEGLGSRVIRVDGTYDDAVQMARRAEAAGMGLLIPDTSGDPSDIVVADVMDGYAVIARELAAQFREDIGGKPSHCFVQAGVGGLAAAVARGLAKHWRWRGRLLTVEPERASCVAAALEYGHPRLVGGDLRTTATMLACGLASAPAVQTLRRHGVRGMSVSDAELEAAVHVLARDGGPATTTSGAAGVAGLLRMAGNPGMRLVHMLDDESCVLLLVTEAAP
ncbi:pyridoxal-phosphate dependent enzyme [Flavobacterium sp. MXW15]|uniref:Pyridoxal-phosphate dependent enzyme n=1 Tax=Xanthomonas chitinilytica TaxID=2989819 RepID=A0ABT3JUP3_9XANT|nr:pyridoxal-phosphate dependent enzyme [Xanthomonas sp. H13-6]MCW4453432.1 pyridoxal-phosphate dependent enzyme [Flavobacterium sp. MXW15]MCW4472215.1 pyridoxal-phosphate dependent enzyme [Xanthomonas sp. H13-6]